MTALATLSGTLSIVLALAISAPERAAGQAERAPITARWEGLVLPSTIAQVIAAHGHGRAVVR